MNDERNDDHRLRDEFQGLKAHVERGTGVPDFEEMIGRARLEAEQQPRLRVEEGSAGGAAGDRSARRRLARVGGWVSLAMAAAAAGLLLVDPTGSVQSDAEFESLVTAFASDGSGGAWRSPTTSLLEVPGLDLGSVPSVGTLMPRGSAIGPGGASEPVGRDS